MPADAPGMIIAAPASGSGKTVITLALLRALTNRGVAVASAKTGPDYIDPMFHQRATARPCCNLDPWAMRPASLARLMASLKNGADLVLAEGVMGLFDGINLPGRPDAGSTADLAALSRWPVVLVVDAGRQAASVGALVAGFANHRSDVSLAGVIFNRVASDTHEAVLRVAVQQATPELTILGAIPRSAELTLPERHLGLVPAGEHDALEPFLDTAAAIAAEHIDLDGLIGLARPAAIDEEIPPVTSTLIPPLGQRIAIARDEAFCFTYPAVLDGWRQAGAELSFFSPLADTAPPGDSDAIYLPGGYPELHAGALAGADAFLDGLRAAAGRGVTIYGECGGYMVLGERLTDADGTAHSMAGLLPVATSFAERRLHLGYRSVTLADESSLGERSAVFRGHEFHYATIEQEGPGQPLFHAANAVGDDLGPCGRAAGTVSGSFIHLIDHTDQRPA